MFLAPKRNVSNITGLQVFGILRFITFLIISIVFTKIGLSKEEIGLFEISVFIASTATFFWVTGIIQAFLPLYKGSKTFGDLANEDGRKSPEIFNTYLLMVVISVVIFLIGLAIQNNFSVFGHKGKVPLLNVTLWYLMLSSPACLVEYIYMIRNQSGNTLSYAYITYTVQLIVALVPVLLGYSVIWSLRGLVAVAIIRNIWLLTLIYNYAEKKFSLPFIKELLLLASPLIFSILISGSAQYVDGIIISTHYFADGFAIFRYGSKELPFVLMLAAGLSNAMLTEFSTKENIKESLHKLKVKSLRIMHSMYPLTIALLFFAKPLFRLMFSQEFTRSADIFVIYLLAIVSRLVFPHTILIGLKKTRILLSISVIEIIINLFFSIWFVKIYGLVGVALGTIIAYTLSKLILIIYTWIKLKISPFEYIPAGWYMTYNAMLAAVFVLLDRGILAL